MSAPKHTPGPWHSICDKGNATNRMAMVQARGSFAIDCTKSGASHAQDCANACLIAAAPDMYAALKLAASMHAMPDHLYRDHIEAMDAVRAAIAKAEGK